MVIISCRNHKREIEQPTRKESIPDNAFWVGGVDGGNWYLIDHVNAHKNTAFIKVYDDGDGSLIMSKRFILICLESNQMWIDDLPTQINAFEGEKIYLNASTGKMKCWLQ